MSECECVCEKGEVPPWEKAREAHFECSPVTNIVTASSCHILPLHRAGLPRLFLTHPQWDVALCKPVQEDVHVGGAFIVFWGPGSDFPLVKE